MKLLEYIKNYKVEKQYYKNYKKLIDNLLENKVVKSFNFVKNSKRDFGTVITLKNKTDLELNPNGKLTKFERKVEKAEHLQLINEYLSEVLNTFSEKGLYITNNPYLEVKLEERPEDEVVLNNDYIVYNFEISFKKNWMRFAKKLEFFVNTCYKILLPIGIIITILLT